MSELYRNKYHSDTARALWWDYGRNGAYFITICTKDRKHFFGKIDSEKMELSETGEIAEKCGMKFRNITKMLNWVNLLLCPIMFMELFC